MAFKIKRHDLRPYLPAQFFKPDGTTPLPLSAAVAVYFIVRSKTAATDAAPLLRKPCVITDAVNGLVEYRWAVGDTDLSGNFNYEFEIMWPNAEPQTIPADSYLDLIVLDDLG